MPLLLRAFSVLALVGCAEEPEKSTDVNPDAPVTPTTPDPDPDPGERYIDAGFLQVDAVFAYDATLGQIVTATEGGQAVSNALYIAFVDRNFDSSGLFCELVLPLESASPPAPLNDPDRWYQIARNPAEAAFTDCHDAGTRLDPAVWPVDIVQAFVDAAPDAFDIVVGQGIVSPEAPFVFGGYLGLNPDIGLPPDPGGGEVYVVEGFGFEMDANYALIIDGDGNPSFLATEDVFNNGQGMPSGIYLLSSGFQLP